MLQFLKKPEWLLAGIPLISLLICRIWLPDQVLDIHLHDTMYVVALWQIMFLLLLPMLFFTVMHFFLHTRKWRNKGICNWHIWISIVGLLVISALLLWTSSGPISDTVTIEQWKDQKQVRDWLGLIFLIVLLLFVAMQIFFLFYFIVGLIKSAIHRK
jgi:cytochrome c oxidase subunit I